MFESSKNSLKIDIVFEKYKKIHLKSQQRNITVICKKKRSEVHFFFFFF